MKIYVSADMEGVAGVVTAEQLKPSGFEYERFRELMTLEVRAVVEGAYDAGATEVVVSDSHGNAQNLLLERLPSEVMVIRSWPRPLTMMEGIDDSFAGAVFLGYHSGATARRGVRAHTLSSAWLTEVRLNGTPMPEAGINAAIAGHFDVPIIMISGDDAAVEEARALLGDLEAAVVKWATGYHSAKTFTPEAARDRIGQAIRRAIDRLDAFEPYTIETPVELEIGFKHHRPAEVLSYLPIVERTGSRDVRFVGGDMLEVSRFLQFVLTYEISLAP